MVKESVEAMTIENVYGQDVVSQGALYLTLLVKAVINIDNGRARNEEDDLLMAAAIEWAEVFGEVYPDIEELFGKAFPDDNTTEH
jgi:hypothetical protein|tara:strand:+ start:131 stop:385 length:255 start_codon:yes stop_codon:yes gene_type:complete